METGNLDETTSKVRGDASYRSMVRNRVDSSNVDFRKERGVNHQVRVYGAYPAIKLVSKSKS